MAYTNDHNIQYTNGSWHHNPAFQALFNGTKKIIKFYGHWKAINFLFLWMNEWFLCDNIPDTIFDCHLKYTSLGMYVNVKYYYELWIIYFTNRMSQICKRKIFVKHNCINSLVYSRRGILKRIFFFFFSFFFIFCYKVLHTRFCCILEFNNHLPKMMNLFLILLVIFPFFKL